MCLEIHFNRFIKQLTAAEAKVLAAIAGTALLEQPSEICKEKMIVHAILMIQVFFNRVVMVVMA